MSVSFIPGNFPGADRSIQPVYVRSIEPGLINVTTAQQQIRRSNHRRGRVKAKAMPAENGKGLLS